MICVNLQQDCKSAFDDSWTSTDHKTGHQVKDNKKTISEVNVVEISHNEEIDEKEVSTNQEAKTQSSEGMN